MKELVYHRLLLPAVERDADRVAFFDGEYRATFGEHLERVARLAAALRGLGVAPDDRFAVMALNGHQFLECYHAAFLGGGVINPLNLRLAPKELEYILADSGTKVCFTDQFFAPVIDKVRGHGYRTRRDDRRGRCAARRCLRGFARERHSRDSR